jgi:hypothetical protein
MTALQAETLWQSCCDSAASMLLMQLQLLDGQDSGGCGSCIDSVWRPLQVAGRPMII